MFRIADLKDAVDVFDGTAKEGGAEDRVGYGCFGFRSGDILKVKE